MKKWFLAQKRNEIALSGNLTTFDGDLILGGMLIPVFGDKHGWYSACPRKRGAWHPYTISYTFKLFLLMALIFCCGCGQPQGQLFEETPEPLVWPEPPDRPRIQYLGQFSTEDDLKPAVSSLEALKRLLFGREDIGVLLGPYALALDGDNRLFIADPAGAVIHIMDLKSRDYQQFSQLDQGEKLLYPVGLTVVGENLYVADSKLARICVFDRQGNFLFSFGEDNLKRPTGIAHGPNGQKIYVADTAQHTIFVFDESGRCNFEIGSRGSEPGQFNFPTQLWIDKMGKLYVSDTLNYRIQVFSENGDFYLTFGRQGDRPGDFAHPCGIAVDNQGNIYVADRQFENIQIFNSDGHILMALGEEGNQPGHFWLPASIYIDAQNRIFVADSYNRRIQVFQLLEQE